MRGCKECWYSVMSARAVPVLANVQSMGWGLVGKHEHGRGFGRIPRLEKGEHHKKSPKSTVEAA